MIGRKFAERIATTGHVGDENVDILTLADIISPEVAPSFAGDRRTIATGRAHPGALSSRVRGHCGCWPGDDLGRAAAGNGAGCSALHGRSRDLRTDRERRTHPALRTQRRTAIETHPAQPSHQYRERPHQSFPQLHAAVLRSSLQEPRSLRPMACRTRQCRSQPPSSTVTGRFLGFGSVRCE